MIGTHERNWTLSWALRERCRLSGDKTFLEIVGDGSETYGATYAAACRLASGLRRVGVGPGASVVIMASNSFPAVHAWFAANLLGAVEVTINTAYRDQLLAHAINIAKAEVIILERRLLPSLAEVEDRAAKLRCVVVIGDGDDVAFSRLQVVSYDSLAADGEDLDEAATKYSDIASIIYTSGTSGPAKGVMLTHAQNFLMARQSAEGLRLTERDIYYCVHPLFHMAGKFLALYAQFLAGGKVVLDKGFVADRWLDRVREYKATVSVGHGPMLEMVFAQPRRSDDGDTALERVLACPMPKRIAAEFEERFGALAIEAYGMTEIGAVCWRPYDEPLRVGSAGRLLEDWYDLRVADPETDEPVPAGEVGQILLRPKKPWTLMQGYIGMPEKTTEAWRNLWFQTGDAGYFDDEGYLHFVDRLGDRIRRRAESISSYDIEVAAMRYPGIADCAAVGVPSEFESDDDVKLCVVLGPDRAFDPIGLLRHLSARLPHYMVPRYVDVLTSLPRTPTNKVMKKQLRADGAKNAWDRKSAGIALRDLVAEERASASGALPHQRQG